MTTAEKRLMLQLRPFNEADIRTMADDELVAMRDLMRRNPPLVLASECKVWLSRDGYAATTALLS